MIATVATAVTVLAGCMQAPPKTAEEFIARCVKRTGVWSLTFQTEIAQHMGVSREKMPELFCRRVLVAAQKGRLTDADLMEAHRRGSPVWKVIKGQ